MSRRSAWTLMAACAWTVWVWLTFMWIIDHQDHPIGFKVVHGLLALGSIAFGLAVGWIGYKARRSAPAAEIPDREVPSPR